MAFAYIKDNNQPKFSFMGVYRNAINTDGDWVQKYEAVSQFDSPPEITITDKSISISGLAVAGMSNAFSHGDQYFRCGFYHSKKVINYNEIREEDGWVFDKVDLAVELHVCKSKSEIEQENSGTNA